VNYEYVGEGLGEFELEELKIILVQKSKAKPWSPKLVGVVVLVLFLLVIAVIPFMAEAKVDLDSSSSESSHSSAAAAAEHQHEHHQDDSTEHQHHQAKVYLDLNASSADSNFSAVDQHENFTEAQLEFVVSEHSAVECPSRARPLHLFECKLAATHYGSPAPIIELSMSSFPPGCSAIIGLKRLKKFYYNSNVAGTASANLICAKLHEAKVSSSESSHSSAAAAEHQYEHHQENSTEHQHEHHQENSTEHQHEHHHEVSSS